MKTKNITMEVQKEIYIAEDGTEFDTKQKCSSYEFRKKKEKLIEATEKLRIEDLDEVIPLVDSEISENNMFRWYKVNNKDDYEVLKKACVGCYTNLTKEPKNYPEIICLEMCDYEEFRGCIYDYTLSECKTTTENFWKNFGYKVTIERNDSKDSNGNGE